MIIEKKILTPTEAAATLGYSTQTIYGYIRSGLLKAQSDPGHRLLKITEKDIEDFIDTWKRMKAPAGSSKNKNHYSNTFKTDKHLNNRNDKGGK